MSVEVERKFLCSADTLKTLEEIGAVCAGQRQFQDQYFDTPKFDLTLRDMWLRKRKGCWELKCPTTVDGTSEEESKAAALCTRYKEITSLPEIQLRVEEVMKDVCADRETSSSQEDEEAWPSKMNLKEEGVQIDLDEADFGYHVGEIEVLVPEGGDVQSALEKIQRTAQKLGPLQSMGSQSSSGMSGGRGSSSGNPAEQSETAEANQSSSSSSSSSRGRRTADRQQGDRQPASEEDVDLAEVLAYLLRRGQVRLVHGSGATGLQLVQSYSDSDEDSDGAWEGRLGDRYNPPVDTQPDTFELDQSEIRTQIMLATASSALKGRQSFTHMLTEREQGRCRGSSFSHGECSRIRTHFLPNYVSHKDTYQQKAFCGVYSEDGNMFLSACQDQNIRLYDTSRGRFHLRRTVKARDVGWSVLDVCFTPDAQHVLYSSWSDYIHLCSIDGDSENHTALDLNPDERRFCVFSLAASTDGNEILGGANDGCLYVFDLEQNKRTLKVSASECICSFCVSLVGLLVPLPESCPPLVPHPATKIDAHEDDVNAVAFADSSSQLLFSGSDDALCKVWDRRTLREDRPQPVGQLAGHRDGITFIHSKGDARYLISNSKDQSIKLWDVRKFSPKEGLAASRLAVTQQNWDYRWQQVPQRVYDVLTGGVVSRLSGHDACVRDVSWHPYEDNIVSSSWDGAVRMWEHRQTHPLEEERERERD
ncbi:DDB1-and CUL4-associated factor 11 [Nibea albiflora]|uniref:DDB1-and CUL4-associated factor 11 n=1 Tax=Nibea albiflora TaxID=240163 RepID=A0ACB7F4W5_NIBAL|nr:DDB1-and CUL4-associated factor 11 [Nibea albiflora]